MNDVLGGSQATSHLGKMAILESSVSLATELLELYPTELLELYCNAINAYLRGEPLSVGEQEWAQAGAVAGYIPTKLSALLMSDFRPIGCICTKYSLLLSIVDLNWSPKTMDFWITRKKDFAAVWLGAERRSGGDQRLHSLTAWLPPGHEPGADGGVATTAQQQKGVAPRA